MISVDQGPFEIGDSLNSSSNSRRITFIMRKMNVRYHIDIPTQVTKHDA